MLGNLSRVHWRAKAWERGVAALAAAMLAGCTVYSTPTGYTYQQTPCPPDLGKSAATPQPAQPQGGTQPAPPAAQQAAPGTTTCYTAIPTYGYQYYPGYPYAPYPYGYPYYPYYYPYYGGVWVGGVWRH